MNRQQSITMPVDAARVSLDYKRAYQDLEDPIALAMGRMKVLDRLVDSLGVIERKGAGLLMIAEELDDLIFMACETYVAVRDLDKQWCSTWGAEAATMASEADEIDAVRSLIGVHRAAMNALGDAMDADAAEESERTRHCEQEQCHAFDALLMWRPTSLAANAERMRYLWTDSCSPWKESLPGERKLNLLLASMQEA